MCVLFFTKSGYLKKEGKTPAKLESLGDSIFSLWHAQSIFCTARFRPAGPPEPHSTSMVRKSTESLA